MVEMQGGKLLLHLERLDGRIERDDCLDSESMMTNQPSSQENPQHMQV
jgi:hypothetical protein